MVIIRTKILDFYNKRSNKVVLQSSHKSQPLQNGRTAEGFNPTKIPVIPGLTRNPGLYPHMGVLPYALSKRARYFVPLQNLGGSRTAPTAISGFGCCRNYDSRINHKESFSGIVVVETQENI